MIARRYLERAAWLFERMGMRLDRARVTGGLGSLALRLGDTAAAIEHFRVTLEVYRDRDLERESATAVVNLGVAYAADEQWDTAIELQREAVEIYRDLGVRLAGSAQAEHNLGIALAGRGDHDAAEHHYRQARRAYQRLGRVREAAETTMNLGSAALDRGDVERARRLHRQARRTFAELKLWTQLARCEHNLGLTWPATSAHRRDRVVAAWLAMDAERFVLDSSAGRARWRESVGVNGGLIWTLLRRGGF